MNKKDIENVATMKSEIKSITKQMDSITPKIEEMYTTFIAGVGKIAVLNREVFGNGKPALRTELNNIKLSVEKKFAFYAGGLCILSIIFTIIVQLILKKYGG